MATGIKFETLTFPSRVADLGFSARLPAGWTRHDLPEEELDFSDPTRMGALAVITAPHAAIVFAFAARPAYDNGSVADWMRYLLEHNQLTPQTMNVGTIGVHEAMLGEATLSSEMGPMTVRFAFFEDGKRLLNITLSAPEMLAGSVYDAWTELLESFTLETPRGATAAVIAAPSPVPNTFPAHALASDTSTLDPEHPVNANLRDRGVGLVPNVVATYEADRRASVMAGAVDAQIDIPFGWHVIDDSKRTLIFGATNQVQISLSLISRDGRRNEAILDEIEAQARNDYPAPAFMRAQYEHIHALMISNIQDGDQPLEQCHMLAPGPDAKRLLRARVTFRPEHRTPACNLAELIVKNVAFNVQYQPEKSKPVTEKDKRKARSRDAVLAAKGKSHPQSEHAEHSSIKGEKREWVIRAKELEAEGKLEEAAEVILQGAQHIGGAASVAQMYRRQMTRLLEAGDQTGALEAFKKAEHWIRTYASWATSGGEGAALSLERDEFRAELVSELGYDPDAKTKATKTTKTKK